MVWGQAGVCRGEREDGVVGGQQCNLPLNGTGMGMLSSGRMGGAAAAVAVAHAVPGTAGPAPACSDIRTEEGCVACAVWVSPLSALGRWAEQLKEFALAGRIWKERRHAT